MAAMSTTSAARAVREGVKKSVSTIITLGGVAFISYGIATGHAALTPNPVVPFVLFLTGIILLGYLEGLQVAILAMEGQDAEPFKESHPRAYSLHRWVNQPCNIQRFLVGRQFCVIFVVMLVSQVSTFPALERPSWAPEVLWIGYVGTALYGALVVLAFGQLMPQLIGARHAVFFLNLPGSFSVLGLTLFMEATGIAHFSWVLTDLCLFLCGFRGKQEDADVEQGVAAASKVHIQAIGKMKGILEKWKAVQDAQELSHFCKDIVSESSQNQIAVVTEAMACEGLSNSGVTTISDIVNQYEPTPRSAKYPTPRQIVESLAHDKVGLPCFLLPPLHPLHVPPHIVAFWLMEENTKGKPAPCTAHEACPDGQAMPEAGAASGAI